MKPRLEAVLREPGVERGLVTEKKVPANEAARSLLRLRRIGRKLAVYGWIDSVNPKWSAARQQRELARAHIVNPGSYSVPQVPNHDLSGDSGLSYGRSLCGIRVATNGYCNDFTPPELSLCPVCAKTN
jgi:hypothetical protein